MATKDFSKKQENMVASCLGWSTVSGSGAPAFCAGDVISDKYLGECKTHVERQKKITFRQDVWNKLCEEAMVQGRIPVYFTDNGSQRTEETYVITRRPEDIENLSSEFHIQSLNLNIKKQINLDSQKIERMIHKKPNTVYTIEWSEPVVLMNLKTFETFQIYG